MKKSVIALAIAAAMPVTAIADVTLEGSVTAKYYINAETKATTNERQKSGLDIDSDLDISSTEVLTNGMTATTTFDVNKGDGINGKVGLSGDFGALTLGSALDADGAFQFADIGAAQPDMEDAAAAPDGAEDATTANAIHYAKSFDMFNIQVQKNASTNANGLSTTNTAGTAGAQIASTQQENTQIGLTSEIMDGLKLGYGYSKNKDASDNADVLGLTYSMDDLDLTYGQGTKHDGTDIDGIISVAYTMDEVKVKYTHDMADNVKGGAASGSGKDKMEVTYTGADNGITVAMEYDQDEDATNETKLGMKVTYVTGDLTMSAERKQDKSTDATISYAMGNANVELARDGSKKNTTVQYKVSF
jgi:hypothetical protein